jgi:hypothetical protein
VVLCVRKEHREELRKVQVLGMVGYEGIHEKSAALGRSEEQDDATMAYVGVCE